MCVCVCVRVCVLGERKTMKCRNKVIFNLFNSTLSWNNVTSIVETSGEERFNDAGFNSLFMFF